MSQAGYIPDMNFVLYEVEEEQKELLLLYVVRSWSLLLYSLEHPLGQQFELEKICGDCHVDIEFISKIIGRGIMVMDSHHFQDEKCSCGGYWQCYVGNQSRKILWRFWF